MPFGNYALYPLTLLGTHLHEGAHALAGALTGARVLGVQVNPDGSGVTTTAGGLAPIIASAGYTGASLAGALLLRSTLGGPKSATRALWGVALLVGVLAVGLGWRSPFTIVTGLLLAAALAWGARKGGVWAERFCGFAAVALAADALRAVTDLFRIDGTTDATILRSLTGIPAPVFSVLWVVAAVAATWWGLKGRPRPV